MKANSLFGIKFITEGQLKSRLLDHFETRKIQQAEALKQKVTERATKLGVLSGISREEMEAELALNHPLDVNALDFTEVTNFLKEDGCKHYYITQSALTYSKLLRAKEPFDLEWLQPINDGKRQLNFGESFIRYQKTGSRIVALSVTLTPRDEKGYLRYSFFNLNLAEKTQSNYQGLANDEDLQDDINDEDYDSASKRLFFQLITFMELAPVEEIFLPAGRKHGTRKSESCLLNETTFPITIVTTNWNRIVHVGKFGVNGHYRLQRCGPRFEFRKLTWVKDFVKHGYNLNAKNNGA